VEGGDVEVDAVRAVEEVDECDDAIEADKVGMGGPMLKLVRSSHLDRGMGRVCKT
jgi:hypothetical protein